MPTEHSGPYPSERTLAVLDYLIERDPEYVPVTEIAGAVDATTAEVSSSLFTLRRWGIVEKKQKNGTLPREKMWRLHDEAAAEVFDYL